MGNHRAPRRGASSATSGNSVSGSSGGKRKAVKHAGSRGPLFRKLPSAPVLLGVAALTISATGAVTINQSGITSAAADDVLTTRAASALTGSSSVTSTSARDQRKEAVSRDSRRDALQDASDQDLQAAAEATAEQRNVELAKLAQSAEKQAKKIALNLWQLPLSSYRLTATFGQSSGLWASTHTGLDFAAPTGTPVMSVTNGTVTSAEYAGSYGNQIIVTTEDGEELWYCHLNEYAASVGDTVRAGEVIGYVGTTGNSTGPHMHLEVRPGAGDPVDPFAALVAHGITP
ncbi:M23 family metallopeptidase [Nocardioides sp. JQ2195]|uniref:M23 family metallopeptidase n=1 Tax=Nocardioides sp. JQ2195 TaxID=2592334 RepID=UPI00143EC6E6|nr:M23 family metallopeptidase [Nocardioides sp. JQ2195]QIX25847.1 M23 family metallopeptidase [Nocardioides sp. JQ2195]